MGNILYNSSKDSYKSTVSESDLDNGELLVNNGKVNEKGFRKRGFLSVSERAPRRRGNPNLIRRGQSEMIKRRTIEEDENDHFNHSMIILERVIYNNISINMGDMPCPKFLYKILIRDKNKFKNKLDKNRHHNTTQYRTYWYQKISNSQLIKSMEKAGWYIRLVEPTDKFDKYCLNDYRATKLHEFFLCDHDLTKSFFISRVYLIIYPSFIDFSDDIDVENKLGKYSFIDIMYETGQPLSRIPYQQRTYP